MPAPPYLAPVPGQAAPWTPTPAPVLVAPVWERQTGAGESELEFAAFTHWLPGNVTAGQVAQRAGLREVDVLRLVRERSWDVRAREYWAQARAVGEEAARAEQAPARAARELSRVATGKALALLDRELDKALVESSLERGAPPPEGPPRLFNNRELIAAMRVLMIDVARERSGLSSTGTAADDTPALNWDKVPADDLEAYRRAREKALGR